MNIGLIAHDAKKKLMQNFCIAYRGILSKHELYATETTGILVESVTNLSIHKFLAGHLGGKQQLGSQIEHNNIDLLIFFRDPLAPRAHEPDVNDIVKLCDMYNIPIHVRSTFTNKPGTIIREEYTMEEKEFIIRGVADDTNVAKIAILGIPNTPGIAYSIFSKLAENNIDVDMIVQSIRNVEKNVTDMVFTTTLDDLSNAKQIIDKVADELNAVAVLIETDVAKVSIVGAGMLGNPGIASRMFKALSEAGINIDVISTSEISISCLIKAEKIKEAVNAIHAEFFKD